MESKLLIVNQLLKKVSEHTKTISLVFGICGSIFGAVTWYANKQVEKYKDSQEKIINQEEMYGFGLKIDKLIESDSLMILSIVTMSAEIQGNTKETKANTKAIDTHLKNEKAWKELVDFWRDQAQNRVIENNSEVPKGIPGIKDAGILTKPGVRKATIVENDSLNKIYGREKIR